MAAIPQVENTLSNWDSNHNSPTASDTITVAGSNTLLVALLLDETAGAINGVSSDVDGALTNLDENLLAAIGCAIWYKKGATVGGHVLTPSYDDTNDETTVGLALALSDVDQSASTFNTVAKDDGSGTSPSVTATTASDELVIDVMGILTANNIITSVGADQTAWDTNGNPGGGKLRVIGSYQDGANGGVMSYGLSSSATWIQMAVSIRGDAGDVTAPTLTSPSGTATGETTADLSVSTDEGNGTLYWVVTESATAPSVAQIQAGQDNSGTAAADSGNQAVSATGTQNANATGLTEGTTYTAHFQHQDAATNDSTVVSSATFTTDSAGAASLLDSPLINSPLTHSRLIR